MEAGDDILDTWIACARGMVGGFIGLRTTDEGCLRFAKRIGGMWRSPALQCDEVYTRTGREILCFECSG